MREIPVVIFKTGLLTCTSQIPKQYERTFGLVGNTYTPRREENESQRSSSHLDCTYGRGRIHGNCRLRNFLSRH